MLIEVKTKDEEGNIIFEGKLNRREVGFILQYGINDLINSGVTFQLQKPDDEEDPPLRMNFPNHGEFDD